MRIRLCDMINGGIVLVCVAKRINVFCSKELAVLYKSYSTATFVIRHSFVLYRCSYSMDNMCCMSNVVSSI